MSPNLVSELIYLRKLIQPGLRPEPIVITSKLLEGNFKYCLGNKQILAYFEELLVIYINTLCPLELWFEAMYYFDELLIAQEVTAPSHHIKEFSPLI